MSRHWSGVEVGDYFELVLEFDPTIYSESEVIVPFHRNEPAGLSTCMLDGFEFTAKSIYADSAFHIRKAIRERVAPPLREVAGASATGKKFTDAPLTSFFATLLPKPKQARTSSVETM